PQMGLLHKQFQISRPHMREAWFKNHFLFYDGDYALSTIFRSLGEVSTARRAPDGRAPTFQNFRSTPKDFLWGPPSAASFYYPNGLHGTPGSLPLFAAIEPETGRITRAYYDNEIYYPAERFDSVHPSGKVHSGRRGILDLSPILSELRRPQ